MALVRKKAQNVVKKAGSGDGDDNRLDWENLEEDDYPGTLVMVADLGLQSKEYKGEYQGDFQQIALGVEIIDEGMEDEEGVYVPRILWTKPFYIYDKLTEKGKELEFYKIFNKKAKKDTVPDWEEVLGTPVTVTVEHTQGTGENKEYTYDNIGTLSSIPKQYWDDHGEEDSELEIGDADDPENYVTAQLRGLAKFVWEKRLNDAPKAEPKKASKKKAKKAKVEEPEEEFEEEEEEAPKPKKKRAAKKKPAKKAKVEEPEEDEEEEEEPAPKKRAKKGSSAKRAQAKKRTAKAKRKPVEDDDEDEDIPY